MPLRNPQYVGGVILHTMTTPSINSAITSTTGLIRLSYFRAIQTLPYTAIRCATGSTPAAATPTVCMMGLYSVASDDSLAQIAVTQNDTTLFAAANTDYQRSFVASVELVAGTVYAAGAIIVSAAATPTLMGAVSAMGGVTAASMPAYSADRPCFSVTGQTTLPPSIAAGSLVVSTSNVHYAIVP